MKIVIVQQDEIDDLPQAQAVYHVADRSPQDQGQTHQGKLLFIAGQFQEIKDTAEGHNRDQQEETDPVNRALSGQDPEGGSRVAQVGEGGEIRDDLDGVIQGHQLVHEDLGDLVEDKDDPAYDQSQPVFRVHAFLSEAMTRRAALHRGQAAG